jgi:CheY-like chemotaxis protein
MEHMSPKRVLVVDDTREIGRMIQAALDTLGPGMTTTVVPTAEEALQEIESQTFDLLVVDVRLPGISGLELTRKLHSRKHSAKVIQISGINDPRLREMATQLGADMFFTKPLIMHEFLAAVEKLITPGKTTPRLGTPPPPPPAKSRPRTQVDQTLAGLLQRLSAHGTAIFDYDGKILQTSGELPTAAAPEFFQVVSASLTAADKCGRYLAQSAPENVLILRGGEFDAAAVPLGGGRAAAVFIQRSPSSVRLAVAVDELLTVQKNLAALLSRGAPAPRQIPAEKPVQQNKPEQKAKPAPEAPVSVPETSPLPGQKLPTEAELDAELSSLFNQHDLPQLKPSDLDAYWNVAANDEEGGAGGEKDMLSFEQAKKLGLAPKESK